VTSSKNQLSRPTTGKSAGGRIEAHRDRAKRGPMGVIRRIQAARSARNKALAIKHRIAVTVLDCPLE
jgi:hypothetical protein